MKRLLSIIVLLTAFWSFGFSQGPVKIDLPDLECAHFDRNQLLFPGGDLAMERFFEKFDSLLFMGEGNLSIMHIGGSHVQAGVFSQQMRDHLLNLQPGLTAGRGLVFPFMKTNTPASYFVSRTGEWDYCRNAVAFTTRMGLAGASVTSADTVSSFTIITRAKNPRDITPIFDFNLVKILGYGDRQPVVHFNNDTLRGIFNEEEGSYTFLLPDYTDSLYVDFNGEPGTFTVTGVYLDNGMPGITYHGIGINGARVESYLNCEDLERDLHLVHPDLVIFGIGINDVAADTFTKEKFLSDYDSLINIIQQVNPDCALLFITNNDSYKRIRKNKYEVNPKGTVAEEAFLELGAKHHAAVWDLFDIMGGLQSMEKWQQHNLAQKDKVHFTNAGYMLVGDLLYNALMDSYMEYLKKQHHP